LSPHQEAETTESSAGGSATTGPLMERLTTRSNVGTDTTGESSKGLRTTDPMASGSETTGPLFEFSETTGSPSKGPGSTESSLLGSATTGSSFVGMGTTRPSVKISETTVSTAATSVTTESSLRLSGTTGSPTGLITKSERVTGQPGYEITAFKGTTGMPSVSDSTPEDPIFGVTTPRKLDTTGVPQGTSTVSGSARTAFNPDNGMPPELIVVPPKQPEVTEATTSTEGASTTGAELVTAGSNGVPESHTTGSKTGTTGIAAGTTVATGSSKTDATTFPRISETAEVAMSSVPQQTPGSYTPETELERTTIVFVSLHTVNTPTSRKPHHWK
ncbi:hypothetical protein NP236_23565, partial [Salmonella enterica]|nr:hypothetical protein [Salmonella enterica]